MKEYPAIIAALPREVKHLVRGWKQYKLAERVVVYSNERAVVAHAGMGPERAALAVQAAMAVRPVTALVSVGLAGGCDPAVQVGDIVRAGVVVDTQSGERYSDSEFRQVLVSAPHIASVQEKQRLFASYSASAVDMEAATVARIAQGHNLPFRAIKVISDDADFEMEELGRFATQNGQFREAAFAAYSVVRPRLWPKLGQLAGNSKIAIEALTAELESQLNWYRQRD
ncbi:phosphorylase family protein [Tunturiibacter lichenicola]|uniref:phosphorylase family protein n=1 Tax=Tunturiibacter lichenicola TaxID=2051959 RepID=UPI0021B47575|nr:phosphorylase [Edaphobacter lichenicola]